MLRRRAGIVKISRGFSGGAPITTKQWEYIEAIEEALEVKFTGKTRQEATEFISKYDEEMQDINFEKEYRRDYF